VNAGRGESYTREGVPMPADGAPLHAYTLVNEEVSCLGTRR